MVDEEEERFVRSRVVETSVYNCLHLRLWKVVVSDDRNMMIDYFHHLSPLTFTMDLSFTSLFRSVPLVKGSRNVYLIHNEHERYQ